MDQQDLFHERIEDAIAAVVDRCGGRKKFAGEMFPDKAPRDAHNLLDAMLNPERREKFSPSQLLYVLRRGREVGCHTVMAFICRDCHYQDAVPVDPQDKAAELQRDFVAAVSRLTQIQEQLARIQSTVRRVA